VKKSILAVTFFALWQTGAFAACTLQDAMAKAQQLGTQVQGLMAKDPQKATAWMQKAAAAQQQNFKPGATIDYDVVCKSYDDMLSDLAKGQ
jgi:hypothetical protein